MKTNYSITSFVALGRRLLAQLYDGTLCPVMDRAVAENPWFTQESIRKAIEAVCTDLLDEEVLRGWLERYPDPIGARSKRVGVVMAGNLPLVGFFDLLCICLCGHGCVVKTSSKDRVLMEYLITLLQQIDPHIRIERWADSFVPDALIASGSDMTRRYFETHYRGVPSLLRGSRYSVALLTGEETSSQLHALGDDSFQYFGLGCRNVSRIFVPYGYDMHALVTVLSDCAFSHSGYRNNYRQARAIRQLRGDAFVDGGFFMLQEVEMACDTPGDRLSEVAYTPYHDIAEVEAWITRNDERLQCVVAASLSHPRRVDFGQAQHPTPEDYPDGIDVIEFLQQI